MTDKELVEKMPKHLIITKSNIQYYSCEDHYVNKQNISVIWRIKYKNTFLIKMLERELETQRAITSGHEAVVKRGLEEYYHRFPAAKTQNDAIQKSMDSRFNKLFKEYEM